MSLYDAVRDMPLTVDGYALDGLEQDVSSGFLRKTTVIRLHGRGEWASARTSRTTPSSTTCSRCAGRCFR